MHVLVFASFFHKRESSVQVVETLVVAGSNPGNPKRWERGGLNPDRFVFETSGVGPNFLSFKSSLQDSWVEGLC